MGGGETREGMGKWGGGAEMRGRTDRGAYSKVGLNYFVILTPLCVMLLDADTEISPGCFIL